MGQSYTQLFYHPVFSTKERRPWLTPEIRPRVHAYLGGAIRDEGGMAVLINGTADPVSPYNGGTNARGTSRGRTLSTDATVQNFVGLNGLSGPPAVERVTGVYEQARYAPPSEALSEGDLAAVRRDLCDLAGVPAP